MFTPLINLPKDFREFKFSPDDPVYFAETVYNIRDPRRLKMSSGNERGFHCRGADETSLRVATKTRNECNTMVAAALGCERQVWQRSDN